MYLKPNTVKWSLNTLKQIPRDQSGLCYFLIFSVVNIVKKEKPPDKSKFENEFFRYFGAPLKGGGVGCFNPFDGRWMAEDYINSTVFGRLLNGSHWWTDSRQGFFDRVPPNQFPAEMKLKENAFEVLQNRTKYPCLKPSALLPLTAMAVLYYRYDQVEIQNVNNLTDLVRNFKKEIFSKNSGLEVLFSSGPAGPLSPYQITKPLEEELISVYPACPYNGEPQINVRLYADDINAVKSFAGISVDQFSDYFRKLIREKGIF
jgi:hypothetical protein